MLDLGKFRLTWSMDDRQTATIYLSDARSDPSASSVHTLCKIYRHGIIDRDTQIAIAERIAKNWNGES